MKSIETFLLVLGAFIAFLRFVKCSIDVKTPDLQIKAKAPTVAQVERLLKCLDKTGVYKNKGKKP